VVSRFGNFRIVETRAGGEFWYHLSDALGSVRQLVDGSGELVFAQSYEPYGDVLDSYGEEGSHYGFTGEMQDAYIKLIYLRSRYYAPTTGRFMTRDVWVGNYNRPLSLNAWNYVEGNPVNYVDPSGYCGADLSKNKTKMCKQMVNWIESAYNITVYWPSRDNLPEGVPDDITCFCMPGTCDNMTDVTGDLQYKEWKMKEVTALGAALVMYQNEMGANALRTMTDKMVFLRGKGNKTPTGESAAAYYWFEPNFNYRPSITMLDNTNFGDMVWVFSHEIAHHLTSYYGDLYLKRNTALVSDFVNVVWGGSMTNPGTGPTNYAQTAESPREDIADSITTYLWARQAGFWIDELTFFQKIYWGTGRAEWQDLDDSRINWIEGFFSDIKALYP
jgi:RHS repeat-associated protein